MVQEAELALSGDTIIPIGESTIQKEEIPQSVSSEPLNHEISVPLNRSIGHAGLQGDGMTVEPSDSVAEKETTVYGILLTPPEPPAAAEQRSKSNDGISFILGSLFILFLVIALRFRNNIKYIGAMLHNLIDVRTRHNVFDDTVRETSLIVLLNLLWCASAGIIGFCVYSNFYPTETVLSHKSVGMLLGMSIAVFYSLFLWWAYSAVGWVFSDRSHAELWVKGFSASQALMAPAFFLTALVAICRPDTAEGVGIAAISIFCLGKLVFIWKGYRIFFNQFSSWVLFLCYLCSLEIVPLILCYRSALLLGEVL